MTEPGRLAEPGRLTLPLWVRLLRFGFTGVLMTGVHVAFAAVLIEGFGHGAAVANGLAFAGATALSFVINTLWSFASRMDARRLLRFLTVSLVGCAVAMTVAGAAQAAGLGHWLGIGLVVLTVPPLTFLLHNFWTYRGSGSGG